MNLLYLYTFEFNTILCLFNRASIVLTYKLLNETTFVSTSKYLNLNSVYIEFKYIEFIRLKHSNL